MRFTALLFIFALAFAEITENDSVLVLDDNNFEEAIQQHESLLVKFYAPVGCLARLLTISGADTARSSPPITLLPLRS